MVNHKNHFVDPSTRVHTNTIEGNWSSIKVSVPKRKRTLQDIEIYLVKYMIERNESGSVFKNIIKYLLIYLFIYIIDYLLILIFHFLGLFKKKPTLFLVEYCTL